MTPDQTSLEAELRELRAATLDDALLHRLEAASEGTLTELSRDEMRLENLLRATRPAAIAPDHMAQLQAIFSGIPFSVNEKIVLFPKANASPRAAAKRPMWAAAAAVALVGAATALMMPANGPQPDTISRSAPPAARVATSTAAGNLVPAGFDRGVNKVSDEGFVWKNNNQPHRLMRLEFTDRVTFKDQFGRTYQVEQPGNRYMLVPDRAD